MKRTAPGISWVPLLSAETSARCGSPARYEADYIKVNGTWKFKHLHAFNRMLAPYEEGWKVRSKVDVFTN